MQSAPARRYEGSARRWIPGFKASRSPFGPSVAIRLAIESLATELALRVASDTRERPDLIVGIPLHPKRRRKRGFNHADAIARRIALVLERPWSSTALERVRDTKAQANLVGRERRENVRGAFRARSRLASTARIWLVDDVLTTGSTLDAASEALLEAGAFEVRALTLAATLRLRRGERRSGANQVATSIGRSPSS